MGANVLNFNFGASNPVLDPVSPRNKMPFVAHERLLLKVSNKNLEIPETLAESSHK